VSAMGARIVLQHELGTVSVVGSGIGRRPDITARALLALEDEAIEPQLVTSTPSRVTFHVAGGAVHRAVRRLHAAFGLHQAAGVEPGLDRVARSVP
jgi:aspartate kinase